ncbi:Glycosyltransferase family 92 protein C33H5.2 [Armadillidium vulgare]|nr:Glycosyltransferase family 92 protein C33H5.2 [Armadillidium vulgare]
MFLLFSAFMDYRDEKEGPLVRILAMVDSNWPAMPTCHLYFSNDATRAPVATKAIRVELIHWQTPKEGEWHPYLITCRGGSKNNSAKVVSLVSYPCSNPSNALRIINSYKTSKPNGRSEKKKKLALCHKFLFNSAQDYSYRIIEWLEIAKTFGIDVVTMYMLSAHPNVKKVLNYYEKTGLVKVIQWTNPGDQLNVPSLLKSLYDTQRYVMFTDENIPYTDCLLRHISSHDYVGVWDMDEFMIPIEANSIPEMIENALNNWKVLHRGQEMANSPTSYLARTSYFLDENIDPEFIEEQFEQTLNLTSFNKFKDSGINSNKMSTYFPFLSHTIRTTKYSPSKVFTKSVHDTSRALALHAHFALYNLEGRIDRERDLYELCPQTEGFIGHFRSKCQGENQTDCDLNFRSNLEEDRSLWMHSYDIIYNTLNTIKELQLF